jgi:hypothetical protein
LSYHASWFDKGARAPPDEKILNSSCDSVVSFVSVVPEDLSYGRTILEELLDQIIELLNDG